MAIRFTRETSSYIYFLKGVFSNFHPASFNYKNESFSNTEQAFMWQKAMQMNDRETAHEILIASSPWEAKSLGRQVKNYNDEVWSSHRYQVMVDVNRCKYMQNAGLKNILLSTEDKILVECNPKDKIWGIGLSIDDDKILDERNWVGQNLLGTALMEVRSELQLL